MTRSEVFTQAHNKARKIIKSLFNRLTYKEALSIALRKTWKHAKAIAKIDDSLELDFQSLI